jgi:hypothetical protein
MIAKHIEIDLSFKMVQGKINLFSISGWDEDAKRMYSICLAYAMHIYNVHQLISLGLLTYGYAFLNWDVRKVYRILFKQIFKVFENTAQQTVNWPYMSSSNQGIRTIGLDMCKKQAGGKCILCICCPYTEYT